MRRKGAATATRLVARVDFPGQALLLGHEVQQAIKVHLLHRLRGGPVQLPGHVIPLRVGVDAELDRGVGFGRGRLVCNHNGCLVGGFHPRLTTHVI